MTCQSRSTLVIGMMLRSEYTSGILFLPHMNRLGREAGSGLDPSFRKAGYKSVKKLSIMMPNVS